MKKFLIIISVLFTSSIYSQYSSIAGMPGAFSRLGFSARGIAMGNAMSAVTRGELVGYYNPAISPFQQGASVNVAYSFLSLDRSLNFLSLTKQFKLGRKKNFEGKYSKPRSVAGLSVGLINSGVSGIEERDNQGIKNGEISTSENLFFLSLSNRFSQKFSVGITFRFYYFKLYKNISSSAVGIDLGFIYKLSENLFIAGKISDINSKYKWNTASVYGQNGRTTNDAFPMAKTIGISYYLSKLNLLLAGEFESYKSDANYLKFGAEFRPINNFYLRMGIDKLNLSAKYTPARPAFGFRYGYKFNSLIISIEYAYVIEAYSNGNNHIIGINFNF